MKKYVYAVALRLFAADQDQALLVEWLCAPHVRQWWGNPKKQMELITTGVTAGEQLIILADEKPVGFLQWEKMTRTDLDAAGLTDIPEGAIDIDIAIGDADYTGSHIASRALTFLIQNVLQKLNAPMIILATSTENHRAKKAFRRAGFHKMRTFSDPEYGRMELLSWKGRGD